MDRALMTGAHLDRRTWLGCAAAALGATLASSRTAHGLARIPVTGKLSFSLPWPLARLDPHDPFDPVAALFAQSVVDTVFGLDSGGEPYPALAAELPRAQGGKTLVRLRAGLVTARGRPLLGADLAFSIRRAQGSGGYPYWADLPLPAAANNDRQAVTIATTDVSRVARALASPLLAVVPRSYDPARPDGTGAMRADFGAGRLVLTRNPKAARGASYLDHVTVDEAADLSSSLRAFERDTTDLGWLGAGLHTPRPGAVSFDAGSAGYIVLRTGNEAGPWGAPGVAQQIIDGIPRERIQHLGLGEMPPETGPAVEWGGPRCDLYYLQGAAQLAELARIVASLIARPGHEVEPRPLPAPELARRRASGTYALMTDVVRGPGGAGLPALVALTAAVDPKSALDAQRRPPKLASFAPRLLTRTLRLGVFGELRVSGAVVPDVVLAKGTEGWDLGSSYRAPGSKRLP